MDGLPGLFMRLSSARKARSTTKIECFVIANFAIWYPPALDGEVLHEVDKRVDKERVSVLQCVWKVRRLQKVPLLVCEKKGSVPLVVNAS